MRLEPRRGSEQAAAEVRVPGRLEQIADSPLTLIDWAHNPDGAAPWRRRSRASGSSASSRSSTTRTRPRCCASCCRCSTASSSRARRNPRALPPATLESLSRQLSGPPGEIVPEPKAALERARELAGPDGAVLATGSIYLIADLVRERCGRASVHTVSP